MPLTIRRIHDDEVDDAFALLQDVGAWLHDKGRRQRITATSREAYDRWQAGGCNHGVFDGGAIAAIFTVVREPLHDWPDVGIDGSVPWLRALAVHPERRGDGIGAEAIRASLGLVTPDEHLYLDCVSDFLPRYYASHGFEHVARQVRAYPDGTYDITLLRRRP